MDRNTQHGGKRSVSTNFAGEPECDADHQLTVLERHEGQLWRCRCDCGREKLVPRCNLGRSVRSCGCLGKNDGEHDLTHNGLTLSLAEWERRIGLTRSGLSRRLERGWSIEEALTPK
jgi:hypothetical protein